MNTGTYARGVCVFVCVCREWRGGHHARTHTRTHAHTHVHSISLSLTFLLARARAHTRTPTRTQGKETATPAQGQIVPGARGPEAARGGGQASGEGRA